MGALKDTDRNLSMFTNIAKWDELSHSYTGIQIADKLNQKNGQDYKLIDAIDIDWNGAFIEEANTYINNTEELLDLVNKLVKISTFTELYARIEEAEIALSYIAASYISGDALQQILTSYQNKLTPGAYISISYNNVISTYNMLSATDIVNNFVDYNTLAAQMEVIRDTYAAKTQVPDIVKDTVVKGADKNYDDLEKISNWIKKQSRFQRVDENYIDNHPDETYYIYVDGEYIEANMDEYDPSKTYYIMKDNNQNIDDLIAKLNELDETIGHQNDDGTYTGMKQDIDELQTNSQYLMNEAQDLRTNMISLNSQMTYVADKAEKSYDYAESAYDMANQALADVEQATLYSNIAYTYAVEAKETIGHPSEDYRFETLTEEDVAILTGSNPEEFTYLLYRKVYLGDGSYTYNQISSYNTETGFEYYKYIPPVESTGFYNRVESAEEAAFHSLYNLNYENKTGSSYAYIKLSPNTYTGDPNRTISFTIIEADIDQETGYINRKGIITDNSLYDSLTYTSKIYKLFGLYDGINGLININDDGIVYIYNEDGTIQHIGKPVLYDNVLILYEYNVETNTMSTNIIYQKEL